MTDRLDPPAIRPPARGTFTFLFSDIEGSTALETRVGRERYAEVLARHRVLLRDVWARHGGYEQGTEGDSFFVLFTEAPDALAAAVEAQRAIGAEPWPDDARIRVRMGLHTGGAERAGDSYVGLAINQAARIAAVAYGGQVLVSGATRELSGEEPIEGVTLVDLGEHRLKDIDLPVRIHRLAADGLATDFPPIRTIEARPGNLPTQLTTFVGRDAELAEASALLERTRLLTMTGPGGTGKTRLSIQLALQVADVFPDGVFFVPLEPVRDPMLVASRIAATVGLIEVATRPIADTLAEWLVGRRILLVLDNFEQVISAAPVVADLLRAAPETKVVVTSRAPLHISGEQEFPVPGLPVPPDDSQRSGADRFDHPAAALDPETLGQYAGVRLFIDRAVSVRPDFAVTNENAPAVAAISARLHGMPLAIELAAARIKLLSPDAILVRLEHQLDLLASGPRDLPARQQTLRGAIAWSYDLLEEGPQRLLDRLSVFASGCDLETAEAICGPTSEIGGDILDGLMELVDQSLVRVDQTASSGDPRFRLLDTIREYAAERLAERAETDLIRDRHRDWYLTLAARANTELSGPNQRGWLDRLEVEHDDIRAVLDRAVAVPDAPVAIGLAFDMWRFWQKHGHIMEARRRLDAMAVAAWSRDDQRLRARLMEALGGTCWWQGDLTSMAACYREALALWEELGDEAEIANASYNAAFEYSVNSLDDPTRLEPDPGGRGMALLQRALAIYRRLGDPRGEANALWGIGNYHYFQRLDDGGVGAFRESLALFRDVGDATMEAWALHMLGSALLRVGDHEEARDDIAHAIRHFHAAGDAAGLTLTLDDMSSLAVADGDLPRAARLRGAARSLTTETGANLAGMVEELYEAGVRPSVRTTMTEAEIARFGAEGAAMTLDEAVAYALEGTSDDDHPAGMP